MTRRKCLPSLPQSPHPGLQSRFMALVFFLVEAAADEFVGEVVMLHVGLGVAVGVFVALAHSSPRGGCV